MRPGKRPGNRRGDHGGSSGGGGDSSGKYPKSWDTRITTRFQRCLVTHDLQHILEWHTPLYTAFVAFSLIAVLVGASTFPAVATYVGLAVAVAIVCGGVAKFTQIESGPNAVVLPTDMRVRSKHTVETNVRTLHQRWVEPLLQELFFFTHKPTWKKLLVAFVAVSLTAEAGKHFAAGYVLAAWVAVIFTATGVRAGLERLRNQN